MAGISYTNIYLAKHKRAIPHTPIEFEGLKEILITIFVFIVITVPFLIIFSNHILIVIAVSLFITIIFAFVLTQRDEVTKMNKFELMYFKSKNYPYVIYTNSNYLDVNIFKMPKKMKKVSDNIVILDL
jgi:low affinity Fe/Cu permease